MDMSTTQASKTTKQPCKIILSPEQLQMLIHISRKEDKFREEVIRDALNQLLRPRIGEIGLSSPGFTFIAPRVKANDNKEIMVWVKTEYWLRLKEIKKKHNVALNAITYTALTNYLNRVIPISHALGFLRVRRSST